jgi:hypothetical protein
MVDEQCHQQLKEPDMVLKAVAAAVVPVVPPIID